MSVNHYKRIHNFPLASYLVFFHCRWRWHSIKQLSFSSVLLDYFSTWLIMASKHSSKHYKISTGSNCLCNISRACAATILWNIGQIKINQALSISNVFPILMSRNLLTCSSVNSDIVYQQLLNCIKVTSNIIQLQKWNQWKIIRFAMSGNRTRVNCLEGSYAHHYTNIALMDMMHKCLYQMLRHPNKVHINHLYIIKLHIC